MATIPCSRVVAFVGSDSLESQGCCRKLHPGRTPVSSGYIWMVVIVYLSSPPSGPILFAAWSREGACSETVVLLVLAGRAGVPVLVRVGVLDGARPLPTLSGVRTEEWSCGTAWCTMKGERRGRGRLLIVEFGPVLHSFVGPQSFGPIPTCASWTARATN